MLIKEKNQYDCKFISISFRQTMTMFQTVTSLLIVLSQRQASGTMATHR